VSVIRVGGIGGGASRTCRGRLIPPVSLSKKMVTHSGPATSTAQDRLGLTLRALRFYALVVQL